MKEAEGLSETEQQGADTLLADLRGFSRDDYNRFSAELRQVENELGALTLQRDAFAADALWADSVDISEVRADIDRSSHALQDCAARVAAEGDTVTRLETARRKAITASVGFGPNQPAGLNVLRWMELKVEQRRHREALARELAEAVGRHKKSAAEQDDLAVHLEELEAVIERFMKARSVESASEVQHLVQAIEVAEFHRDRLSQRAAAVDRAVDAPLAILRDYEAERSKLESLLAALRSKRVGLDHQYKSAERLQTKLDATSDGRDRRIIHEKCEREFGVGRPRQAMNELRIEMGRVDGEARNLERQIERIDRDIAKTRDRIRAVAAVAAREIRALVVDGNNCCYEDSQFVGLAALHPMTTRLSERYSLIVVFDAAIRSQLGISDDAIRLALPKATVHVVANKTKADETILDSASDNETWIISNDRYAEYRERPAVRDGRLIRHEIVGGRILVHDLDVNEVLTSRMGVER